MKAADEHGRRERPTFKKAFKPAVKTLPDLNLLDTRDGLILEAQKPTK